MSNARKFVAVALLLALAWADAPVAEVQPPKAYPPGTTDFSAILRRLGALNPEVLAAATYFADVVAITRQMKDLGVNPRMYGGTVGVDLPTFYAAPGRTAEFVYRRDTGALYAESTYPGVEVNKGASSTTRPSQIAVAS